MDSLSWNLSVAGAALCILYGWFLNHVSQSQGVWTGKTGPLVVLVGTVVLTSMAITGPRHVLRTKLIEEDKMLATSTNEGYTLQGYPRAGARFAKALSVISRTTKEVGHRPSKQHVAYENPHDGDLSWITASEYARLLREDMKSNMGGR